MMDRGEEEWQTDEDEIFGDGRIVLVVIGVDLGQHFPDQKVQSWN